LDQMKADGVRPRASTWVAVAQCVRDRPNFDSLAHRLATVGQPLNADVAAASLRDMVDFDMAVLLLTHLRQFDLPSEEQIYAGLMSNISTCQEARFVLTLMRKARVVPSLMTWNAYFWTLTSFKMASTTITKMQTRGVEPNLATIRHLARCGLSAAHGDEVQQLLDQKELQPTKQIERELYRLERL
jgi:hypothetical protein